MASKFLCQILARFCPANVLVIRFSIFSPYSEDNFFPHCTCYNEDFVMVSLFYLVITVISCSANEFNLKNTKFFDYIYMVFVITNFSIVCIYIYVKNYIH